MKKKIKNRENYADIFNLNRKLNILVMGSRKLKNIEKYVSEVKTVKSQKELARCVIDHSKFDRIIITDASFIDENLMSTFALLNRGLICIMTENNTAYQLEDMINKNYYENSDCWIFGAPNGKCVVTNASTSYNYSKCI